MNASGVSTMARPKKNAPKPSTSASADDRQAVIVLKGSPAYVEWLDAIHKSTHIPKTSIVRLALAQWAKANGHPAPPEI